PELGLPIPAAPSTAEITTVPPGGGRSNSDINAANSSVRPANPATAAGSCRGTAHPSAAPTTPPTPRPAPPPAGLPPAPADKTAGPLTHASSGSTNPIAATPTATRSARLTPSAGFTAAATTATATTSSTQPDAATTTCHAGLRPHTHPSSPTRFRPHYPSSTGEVGRGHRRPSRVKPTQVSHIAARGELVAYLVRPIHRERGLV